MAGKNPAFQFYPSDWSNDTWMLSLEEKGAWADILCAMWWNGDKGKITGDYEEFGRLLRVTKTHAEQIIKKLIYHKICDYHTDANQNLTLINRRMVREEKERKSNADKVKRHYYKNKEKKLTESLPETNKPSSSSTSTSSSNKEKKSTARPSEATPFNFAKDIESTFKDVKSFIGKAKKLNYTDIGIVHALRRYKEEAEKKNRIALDTPWAFCFKVLKEDDGKANARVSEKEHKGRMATPAQARDILKRIQG